MPYYYLDLVYTYDSSTSTYEVYVLMYWRVNIGCYVAAYSVRSGVDTAMPNNYTGNDGSQFCSFAKLAEGDSIEIHVPVGDPDYVKGVYTAANGELTATSEHNILSSINKAS